MCCLDTCSSLCSGGFLALRLVMCPASQHLHAASLSAYSSKADAHVQAGLELPESLLYTRVPHMDRQLDAKLAQHRAHVAVLEGSSKKTLKTLRVFLQSRRHNTSPSQSGQASGQHAPHVTITCWSPLEGLVLPGYVCQCRNAVSSSLRQHSIGV